MTRASLEDVVATVDSLLAGAIDCTQLPQAVERMRLLFDGSKACFARVGADLGPQDAIATDPDQAMQERVYGDLSQDFGSYGIALSRVPVGKVYLNEEVLGDTLRHSRIWNEWMKPQDMYVGMGCRVLESGGSHWFFDVERGQNQPELDTLDVALLERLAPVLKRVAELRRHVGLLELQRDMARSAMDVLSVAIAIVDRSLHLVYANAMADELFANTDAAIGLRSGKLFARDRADHCKLSHLVAGTICDHDAGVSQRTQLLLRPPTPRGAGISLCVMPIPAGYGLPAGRNDVMIAARPLTPSADLASAAQQLFALTECEANFAAALASGLSLAEAADEQGVRISTARTHLARIFQKTGTRQQSQVAALLRSAELPLRPERA